MPHDSQPTGFKPYIPASANLPELTPRALIMGILLGMVFGASSLYLVLKVGLTVSASIPVAVIAITLFGLAKKMGGKDSTILENSITLKKPVGNGCSISKGLSFFTQYKTKCLCKTSVEIIVLLYMTIFVNGQMLTPRKTAKIEYVGRRD